MSVRPHLLAWQWRIYSGNHRHRVNLLIHIVAVPLFWLGIVAFIGAIAGFGVRLVLIGAVLASASLLLQNFGHKQEIQKPEPFLGFDDFISRFVVEQLITFPRFVLSGDWLRNLRH